MVPSTSMPLHRQHVGCDHVVFGRAPSKTRTECPFQNVNYGQPHPVLVSVMMGARPICSTTSGAAESHVPAHALHVSVLVELLACLTSQASWCSSQLPARTRIQFRIETNSIHLVLFGMLNRTFGPYLTANGRILISLMVQNWWLLGSPEHHQWLYVTTPLLCYTACVNSCATRHVSMPCSQPSCSYGPMVALQADRQTDRQTAAARSTFDGCHGALYSWPSSHLTRQAEHHFTHVAA
jgi:hypothetical protein